MTEISEKRAFPVKIGTVELYCEKMTMSAKTILTVNPTIKGTAITTNKCRRLTEFSFTGRVYNKEKPMFLAGLANNLNGTENVEIIYKDLRFARCIVTGYSAVDSGEDYIELTINAATSSIAYFLEGVTE